MNKTRFLRSFPLLVAGTLLGGQIAQAVEVDVSGSKRPRDEYVDAATLGNAGGDRKANTTMQTRINVKATVDEDVSAFVQIQDVRTWGGETPTGAPPSITQTGTSISGHLDLHQAFFTLGNVMDSDIALKIGRQEMVYDGARLIGNIGWIQQAQSFDAVRADTKLGDLGLTAFYAQTTARETHPTLGGTLATPGNTFESSFSGLRATWSLGGKDRITPYVYYAFNPTAAAAAVPTALNIIYTGLYVSKHIGDFKLRFDGAYQSGEKSTTVDYGAYMLTAAVSTKLDIAEGANVALWVDYLSGDDGTDATKVKNFTTPYATNHKFYGHMDYFLNNPPHGLIDYAFKASVKATPKLRFQFHAHKFQAAKATAVLTDKDLGAEIDLDMSYAIATNTKLRIGYSYFFKGGVNPLAAKGNNGGNNGNTAEDGSWAWMQMQMKF
jgi:hypothetical protein